MRGEGEDRTRATVFPSSTAFQAEPITTRAPLHKPIRYPLRSGVETEGSERFELSEPFSGSPVFKTGAFGHSANFPRAWVASNHLYRIWSSVALQRAQAQSRLPSRKTAARHRVQTSLTKGEDNPVWIWRDSNSLPPACKTSALPDELQTQ